MNRPIMKGLLSVAITLGCMFGAQADAATPVWQDEFNGPSHDTGATGWQGFTSPAYAGGTVTFSGGSTEWSRLTWPLNTEYTVEFSMRFPAYDGTNFNAGLADANQPIVCDVHNSPTDGLRFEIYRGTSNHHRVQWYAGGTSDRECQIPANAYYSPAYNTDWQKVQMVLGPSKQALYINGALVHFTRYDLSASTKEWSIGLKGGDGIAQTEFDYVRVYAGDESPGLITPDLIYHDGFDQKSVKNPGDGFRLNEEYWENDAVSVPNGLGQSVLLTGSKNSLRANAGGRPYSLVRTTDEETTLEVWLRCPQGTDLQEQSYLGINETTNGDRIELYFRGGGWRPYVRQGSSGPEFVGTQDIRTYFVGDPTTDFQRVSIHITPTSQDFYVNEVFVEHFSATLTPGAFLKPFIQGQTALKTVELDSFALYDTKHVPVEVSAMGID